MKTAHAWYSILIKSLFSSLCLLSSAGFAQVIQEAEYTLSVPGKVPAYESIPAGEYGAFIYSKVDSYNGRMISIMRVDTTLKPVWDGGLNVKPTFDIISWYLKGEFIYFLFQDPINNRSDFELIKINVITGSYYRFQIPNALGFYAINFAITEKAALVGGYYSRVPVVIYYSFTSGFTKILPGLINDIGEMADLVIHDSGNFDLLILAKNWTGKTTAWIKNYDPDGNLYTNSFQILNSSKNLISAKLINLGEKQLVAGSYGNPVSKFSAGIYVAQYIDESHQKINYYPFTEFRQFFSYLKPKRREQVVSRIERRKLAGKSTRRFYKFLTHVVFPYQDQFYLLGECYSTRFSSIPPSASPVAYGNTNFGSNAQYRFFDGYRYSHAVLAGFNTSGEILWDNQMEINDIKTFTLKQYVQPDYIGDTIRLAYLFDNKIRVKKISPSEVVAPKTAYPVTPNIKSSLTDRGDQPGEKLIPWFNDYYLVQGIREIGPNHYFYLSKVRIN